MNYSLNEIESMSKLAARGAGFAFIYGSVANGTDTSSSDIHVNQSFKQYALARVYLFFSLLERAWTYVADFVMNLGPKGIILVTDLYRQGRNHVMSESAIYMFFVDILNTPF